MSVGIVRTAKKGGSREKTSDWRGGTLRGCEPATGTAAHRCSASAEIVTGNHVTCRTAQQHVAAAQMLGGPQASTDAAGLCPITVATTPEVCHRVQHWRLEAIDRYRTRLMGEANTAMLSAY